MLLGLHAGSTMHTNVVTDIRIAKAVGYDAIEIWVAKLQRYLDSGYRAEDLVPALGALRPAMLNCLLHIERQEPEARRELRRQTESLCVTARTLHCPTLQVIALNALRGEPWPEIRQKTGRSLAELADIAAPFGVRLALEPVSFSPMRTLAQSLEVLDVAARDNVGLCVDTFHLWTGGTPWDDVARLDPSLIVVAHLSDVTPRAGEEWADADRDVLPGDGILPLKEGVAAIRATGYDGLWSVELLGAHYWEWEPTELARELKRRTELLLAG
jgi:sugar phosphate isomerase/epimerase